MIKKIAFATDFSKYSSSARDYALEIAKGLGCKVYVVHAIEPIHYEEDDEEIKEFYRNIELEVDKKIGQEQLFFADNGVQTSTDTVIGTSWKVINTYAKEKEIDLIVMGSHGLKTDKEDIVIGTTSHKVVLTSPCPVLIVRYQP